MMSLTTSAFAPKFSVKTPAMTTTRRAATTTTRARLDSGVGAFGSKAGMTQIFTEEGLCVPVTVIAVREGNIVTQVRI
jgi:large subunit ribosomal protein L3